MFDPQEQFDRALNTFLFNTNPMGRKLTVDLGAFMGDLEKKVIEFALRRCNGNQTYAAKALGINRNTLAKRIAAYGWDAASFRP